MTMRPMTTLARRDFRKRKRYKIPYGILGKSLLLQALTTFDNIGEERLNCGTSSLTGY